MLEEKTFCRSLQTDQNTMIRHMEDLIRDFDSDLISIIDRKRELATRSAKSPSSRILHMPRLIT
jgi:Txe/YoeB family toxin of Txe-Axe toxin-antitoxin module